MKNLINICIGIFAVIFVMFVELRTGLEEMEWYEDGSNG